MERLRPPSLTLLTPWGSSTHLCNTAPPELRCPELNTRENTQA